MEDAVAEPTHQVEPLRAGFLRHKQIEIYRIADVAELDHRFAPMRRLGRFRSEASRRILATSFSMEIAAATFARHARSYNCSLSTTGSNGHAQKYFAKSRGMR